MITIKPKKVRNLPKHGDINSKFNKQKINTEIRKDTTPIKQPVICRYLSITPNLHILFSSQDKMYLAENLNGSDFAWKLADTLTNDQAELIHRHAADLKAAAEDLSARHQLWLKNYATWKYRLDLTI